MIPEIETKSAREIKSFQEELLSKALKYLGDNSPFYQRIFNRTNVSISEIRTLEDLRKLSVTNKDDLQKYNDEFLCVPKSKIIDYVTTSGTMGKPVTFALTDKDLDRLAYNEAISFACSGITKNDTIQLMTTMDRRFMAGLAYFLGARKMGASIIRVGSGIPELQWDSIMKFNPTYLICVPSFLLKMIDYAKENNIDLNQTSVKSAICIGEPIRDENLNPNALSEIITKDWNLKLFSTYASTEMSTAFNECKHQIGGHHHPDLLITEFLDENNEPAKDGEIGELTITHLGVEGMPLLRFKTGDLMHHNTEPCNCGRNTLRLGPVIGRTQQMIKYKGTTLYPPAMQNALNELDGVHNYLIEIYTNSVGTDEIKIKVASQDNSENFLNGIKDHFRAKLRVSPSVEFVDSEDLKLLQTLETGRKILRVLDRR